MKMLIIGNLQLYSISRENHDYGTIEMMRISKIITDYYYYIIYT